MSAKDLAARAAAVGSPRPRTTAPKVAAEPASIRTKPVRLSTDISPNAYRDLNAYCAEVAAQVGKARIAHTLVLRKLIDALHTDSRLREQIADAVTKELRK